MQKRKFATNAEKQRAYRERKRNAKASIAAPILTPSARVTKDPRFGDPRFQWICRIDGKDVFAGVVLHKAYE